MAKHKRKPFTNVVVKKLGRYRVDGNPVWGMYVEEDDGGLKANTILLDPRMKDKSFLNTLVHELVHKINPDWSETRVIKAANGITETLWNQGYRKITPKC